MPFNVLKALLENLSTSDPRASRFHDSHVSPAENRQVFPRPHPWLVVHEPPQPKTPSARSLRSELLLLFECEPKIVGIAPAGRFRAFVSCQRRTFRCRRCHCRNAASKGKALPTHLRKLDLVDRIRTGTTDGGLNGTTAGLYAKTPSADRPLRQIDPKKRLQAPKKAASTPFRRPRRQWTETSCKPSSVGRLFRRRSGLAVISLGMSSPTSSSTPPVPTRGPRAHRDGRGHSMRGTACACTRWGLPCPVRHRSGRCALTAPFHPYLRPKSHRRFLFCGTFPDPQPASRWVLPTTVVLPCSDFPRREIDATARSPPRSLSARVDHHPLSEEDSG